MVEDDPSLSKAIPRALREAGLDVDLATRISQGSDALSAGFYDVVILDWALPDGTALDLLPEIPEATKVILYSGLDRTRELAASGVEREPDYSIGKEASPELLTLVHALRPAKP